MRRKVRATDVSLVTNLAITQAADLAINFKYVAGANRSTSNSIAAFSSGPSQIGGRLGMFRISKADNTFEDWALQIALGSGVTIDSTSRMWRIVRYRLLS